MDKKVHVSSHLSFRWKGSFFEACACRPLRVVSVCFLLFSLAVLVLAPSFRVLFLGVSGVGCMVGALCCVRRTRKGTFLCFLVALSALACLVVTWISYETGEKRALALFSNTQTVRATGTVTDVCGDLAQGAPFYFLTDTVDGKALAVSFAVESDQANLSVGDRVTGTFSLSLPETVLYYRDEAASLRADHIFLCATWEDGTVEPGEAPAVFRLRDRALRLLADKPAGAYLSAVLLGDKSGLSENFLDALSRTGTRHLFALSGLHLTLIVGTLFRFLTFLCVPRPVRYALTGAFCAFYTVLAGAPLSLCRASAMLILLYLSGCLRLRFSAVDRLFCASALLVSFDPNALFDTGFRLSALATLGILLCVPALERSLTKIRAYRRLYRRRTGALFARLLRFLVVSFATSLAAVVFTFPIVASFYGEFSLLSPFYNLVLVALFRPALLCAVLYVWVLFLGIPFLGTIFGAFTEACFSLIRTVVDAFAKISFGCVELEAAALPVCTVFLVGCVLFCLLFSVRTRVILLVPLVCFFVFGGAVAAFASENRSAARVYLSDYTRDERLIVTANQTTVLLEAAMQNASPHPDRFALACAHLGVRRANALVLPVFSAGVADHVAAIYAVLPFDTLFLPEELCAAATGLSFYEDLLFCCASHHILLATYQSGETLLFSDIAVTVAKTLSKATYYEIAASEKRVLYSKNSILFSEEHAQEPAYDAVLNTDRHVPLSRVSAPVRAARGETESNATCDLLKTRVLLLRLRPEEIRLLT